MQNQNKKNTARVTTTVVLTLCIFGLVVASAAPMAQAATCEVYSGGQLILRCASDGKGACAAGHFESPSFSGDGCFAVDYP